MSNNFFYKLLLIMVLRAPKHLWVRLFTVLSCSPSKLIIFDNVRHLNFDPIYSQNFSK